MNNILIVEDKKSMVDMLRKSLQSEGFSIVTTNSVQGGLNMLSAGGIDAVVTDLKLPDGQGIEILKAAKECHPFIPVIIMTAYGSIEIAVKAVKDGAYDFITKPFDPDHLVLLLRRAISEKAVNKENIIIKNEFADFFKIPDIVGESLIWKKILEKVKRVSPLKTTVLLLGESGTGKELLARTIHHLSPRSGNPFVAINCAAVPKDLVENEIFGHEKGAFTGAHEIKHGKFELADKGTIFLDEIGDMSLTLQSKLLRILQESEFERVGGTKTLKVDVRVIAASNKDLQKEAEKGNFRDDLFYRLNVFPIFIPPLRERTDDILPIARFFLSQFCMNMGKGVISFSQESERILLNNEWKGNVRELRNAIERAVILCDGLYVLPEHLIFESKKSGDIIDWEAPLHEVVESALRSVEITKIQNAMRQSQGNKTRAAELLKISYKTLLTKIKEYGIE
ncbi:MAG: sigma-54-dependent Fis family transcriptional regulator [Bacteroidetes bacterium]|nr:sigma-54-dependent Fis family transcriptional regulator [Bacteroidota bacterium]